MKVLYLVPQPKRAGQLSAYSFLDEEIHGLAAAGVEPYVLSTKAQRDADIGPVKVRALPSFTSVAGYAQNLTFSLKGRSVIPLANLWQTRKLYRSMAIERFAAELVETEEIDVIHSHFGWPGSFGGVLARTATGRPLIACLRGADICIDVELAYGRRLDPYHDRAIRRLLAGADRTVYFSEFMRDCGVSLGAPSGRTRVVEKGVDRSRFAPAKDRFELKARLGLPHRPMVLTVAALIPLKGVHYLLEAAARLCETHDFSLVICGDGVERDRVQGLSETLGVASRTYFRGRVDRETIPAYFAACDVFVLASTIEAAGNVLLEAMASARPVVCTASGGPSQYIHDGETGFVVPVADVQALADRIRVLLDNPALADRLGEEGHSRTQGRFDSGRMVGDVVRIYHDVVAEARGRLSARSLARIEQS